MSKLAVHTIESAPKGSKESLKGSVKSFGMLPNLHGVLAESPNLLEAYKTLHKLFSTASFNNDEQTVIWQTINVYNKCHYCVPAHTAIAHMSNVDAAITEALRNNIEIPNAKLEALRQATLSLLNNQGNMPQADQDAFYAAGYNQQNLLDIILGMAQKTISNYTNHLAHTPVDEPFKKFAWQG
jgi:AhpD family alkylhydroperoxidase